MVSVVIIAKNEAHIIGTTLQSLRGITDDVVVVDNGSTDGTQALCIQLGARVLEVEWLGYGPTKNIGIDAARHHWILNIDADEALDEVLRNSIAQLQFVNEDTVYECAFKNFFCGKWIRYGEWGTDWHVRLFNKNKVRWNTAAVHENLQLPDKVKVQRLQGHILHYTVQDMEEYMGKTMRYARLNARKYFEQGKKAGFFKLRLAAGFSFFKNYLLRLGFLDGWEGYLIARTTAWYTFLKYAYLRQMNAARK